MFDRKFSHRRIQNQLIKFKEKPFENESVNRQNRLLITTNHLEMNLDICHQDRRTRLTITITLIFTSEAKFEAYKH